MNRQSVQPYSIKFADSTFFMFFWYLSYLSAESGNENTSSLNQIVLTGLAIVINTKAFFNRFILDFNTASSGIFLRDAGRHGQYFPSKFSYTLIGSVTKSIRKPVIAWLGDVARTDSY